MTQWIPLDPFTQPKGQLDSPWILAYETIGEFNSLKFEAKGKWQPVGSVLPVCGPDGSSFEAPGLGVSTKCRPGALMGRLGGSTADSLSENNSFPIGAFCIRETATPGSPLFLSFNFRTWPIQIEELEVKVWGRHVAPAEQPAPQAASGDGDAADSSD